MDKLKIDDVVGAISAHLVAGIWGTLAVGLLGGGNLMAQITGIVAIGVFMVVTSSVICLGLQHNVGIRAAEEAEEMGLDTAAEGVEDYPAFGHGTPPF